MEIKKRKNSQGVLRVPPGNGTGCVSNVCERGGDAVWPTFPQATWLGPVPTDREMTATASGSVPLCMPCEGLAVQQEAEIRVFVPRGQPGDRLAHTVWHLCL